MYIVFRCKCGKILYCKEHQKTHKCSYCNTILNVKSRRVIAKSDDVESVREYVQQLKDDIYHNTDFITGNNI